MTTGNPVSDIGAQDSLTPVLEGDIDPNNATWSVDGSSFTFQENFFYEGEPDLGVVSQTFSWFTYDMVSDSLSQTNVWPYQPYVTDNQIEKFEIATYENQISFIFPSPNRRFWVYAAKRPDDWSIRYPLGIVDLQTEKHIVITEIIVRSLEEFSWSYDVIWNSASDTFLILTSGYEQLPYLVSGINEGIENIRFASLYRDGVSFGDKIVSAWYAYDLSFDGKQSLLANYTGENFRLFLWAPSNADESKMIFPKNVFDATFGPNDSTVFYWNNTGLQKYVLATGNEETLLSSQRLSGRVSFVSFSSDAAHVAVVTNDLSGPDRLYIIDVASFPS